MSIKFAPEDEELIVEIIETGAYTDSAAVVHDALIELSDKLRLQRLQEMVDEADAEIARGDYFEWTPDLMSRLRADAQEKLRLGLPIDPDVCP